MLDQHTPSNIEQQANHLLNDFYHKNVIDEKGRSGFWDNSKMLERQRTFSLKGYLPQDPQSRWTEEQHQAFADYYQQFITRYKNLNIPSYILNDFCKRHYLSNCPWEKNDGFLHDNEALKFSIENFLLYDMLGWINNEKSVLDIGSYKGFFLKQLLDKKFKNILGLEQQSEFYEIALNKTRIPRDNMLNLSLRNFIESPYMKKFDTVIVNNISPIYDIDAMKQFMQDLRTVVKDDGRLVIGISSVNPELVESGWSLKPLLSLFHECFFCFTVQEIEEQISVFSYGKVVGGHAAFYMTHPTIPGFSESPDYNDLILD